MPNPTNPSGYSVSAGTPTYSSPNSIVSFNFIAGPAAFWPTKTHGSNLYYLLLMGYP